MLLCRTKHWFLPEVLVSQTLREVDGFNVFVGAMVEYHASVPPFFWQMMSKSSIVSSKDCRCSTS